MNYIWEQLIQTVHDGLNASDIHFLVFRNNVSPHLEILADVSLQTNINKNMLLEVDVNPYMRFSKIFYAFTQKELGDPEKQEPLINVVEYQEFTEATIDVVLHYLAEVDWLTGLTKHDFHIKLIIKDMENGIFGDIKTIEMLNANEKVVLADQLIALYRTGDNIPCLLRAISKIFSYCQAVVKDGEELVFYFREPQNMEIDAKIRFVIRLFLPISIDFSIHWLLTYGIVDYDNTMFIEEFIL